MPTNSITVSDPKILELTTAVANLARRVESLEKTHVAAEQCASDYRAVCTIQNVERATEALFGTRIAVEQTQDPELDEQYFVIRVLAGRTPERVAEQYREWHRRIGDWAPGRESQFRLAVEFVDDE